MVGVVFLLNGCAQNMTFSQSDAFLKNIERAKYDLNMSQQKLSDAKSSLKKAEYNLSASEKRYHLAREAFQKAYANEAGYALLK